MLIVLSYNTTITMSMKYDYIAYVLHEFSRHYLHCGACCTCYDVAYGYYVWKATSTSTVLPSTTRTSAATPKSTAVTSVEPPGMANKADVFIAFSEKSIQQMNFIW